MIKEKRITIQINSCNMLPYYRKIGYDLNFRDKIEIPVEHLPKGSHVKITAICDNCGKEKKMMYKTYINSVGGTYNCIKCKDKKDKTMKEKYGFEHALQCKEFKDKCQKKWMDNYGTDHPMKNNEIKNKQHDTMINLYGNEHALCNEEIISVMLNKQIEKYGMLFVQTEEFKSIITCVEKYGYPYATQNQEILEKILKTSKKIHKYKNTELYYQGSYEKDFLELCEKIGIIDKIKRGFSIKYKLDENILIYFPDFYISELNLIIEIKSSYWYKVHEKRNIQKELKCVELGYDYLILLDRDYSNFTKKIKSLL